MRLTNATREAASPGSGTHVTRGGITKGAIAAVKGDLLSCEFKVQNTSSGVSIPGAKLHAG